MNGVGDRLTLQVFLTRASPQIDKAVADALDKANAKAADLASHLAGQPELAAQVEKFRETLPPTVATASHAVRAATARQARTVLQDIKKRWIAADAPPLVDEIDDRLMALNGDLTALERPQIDGLAEAAQKIDQLNKAGTAVQGIEQRLALPALAAAILFVAGVIFFFKPTILLAFPPLASFWTIIFCVGALPCLGAYYAFRTRPRARADAQIDALNKEYFLPNGGIYFPEGPREACVVLVDWTPPPAALPLGKGPPKDPRVFGEKKGRFWWW